MLEKVLIDGILHRDRKMSGSSFLEQVGIRVSQMPVKMDKRNNMRDFVIFNGLL
jgi:hypothetical protein